MRKYARLIPFLLLVFVAMPLGAQEVTCDEIAFDQQAMTAYPMVREACLDVIEHEGTRYASLVARVRQAGPPSMLVIFKHRDGSWGPLTRITPAADARAYMGGEMVDAATVPAGSEIRIFLPEGRWAMAMSDAEDLMIAEAEFAALDVEVTAEELPEEVDIDAPAMTAAEMEAAAGGAAGAAERAPGGGDAGDAQAAEADREEATADAPDESEWMWILGLAGAFIIVWLLLRRRKARREA